MDAQALRLFQTAQRFFFGQFLEIEFVRKHSKSSCAFVWSEDHPVGFPFLVCDFHSATRHGREEFRQKMQAGNMLFSVEAAKNFGDMAALIAADVSQ
ncbi:MAG TPA: hypothetical protein VH595_24195 [Verrucomicrobiae bacterium]|nr:hypothetical protein [Verrucomicrobiae bacterium]